MVRTKNQDHETVVLEPPRPIFHLPVQFGRISIGDGTVNLPASVPRDLLNIMAADEALSGKRLDVRLRAGADAPGQTNFVDDDPLELRGSADVKRFGVTPKRISWSFVFARESVDLAIISKLATQAGVFEVAGVAEIPEDRPSKGRGKSSDDDDDELEGGFGFEGE